MKRIKLLRATMNMFNFREAKDYLALLWGRYVHALAAPNAETVAAMEAARRGELITVGRPENLLGSLNEG